MRRCRSFDCQSDAADALRGALPEPERHHHTGLRRGRVSSALAASHEQEPGCEKAAQYPDSESSEQPRGGGCSANAPFKAITAGRSGASSRFGSP